MLTDTRNPEQSSVEYAQALLDGLAPSGGLYVPEVIPRISQKQLEEYAGLPYEVVFTLVHDLFVGDSIPLAVQNQIAMEAYGPDNFPQAQEGVVAPVRRLDPNRPLYMLDLFEGPTLAFKDFPLQVVGREMDFVLGERDEYLEQLGATSGDTGSAAGAAMQGRKRIKLFMLSPDDRMSAVQIGQMGVQTGQNVFHLAISGTFDRCQDMVKSIKKDYEFTSLGAVNSINWGRIASQIPYYVSGYLDTVQQAGLEIGQPIDVVIPSGNFGNALAAFYAREMGVPIRNIILATNENDVLDRLVQSGEYRAQTAAETSSPSMDIGKSSNYERLVYHLMGDSAKWCRQYMEQFESQGRVSFREFGLDSDLLMQAGFRSGRSTHADRIRTIRDVFAASGMVIDPHTADGVKVANYKAGFDIPVLVLGTAHPSKFEDTVAEAIGRASLPPRPVQIVDIEERGKHGRTLLPNSEEAVKQFIRNHRFQVA